MISIRHDADTPQHSLVSFVIISKDEPALDVTLTALEDEVATLAWEAEVLVVDASEGRLGSIRTSHPSVRWLDFAAPSGVSVSIPHQRNAGVDAARGDVIVFTDCGCIPEPSWARRLLSPILAARESVTVGRAVGRGETNLYRSTETHDAVYLAECPTINVAFTRDAFNDVGGFDEGFAYGSDIDFSWRLMERGYRLFSVPDAVVTVDWGSPRRQLRRAWFYGRARARLYRKHRHRIRTAWRLDPVPFAYAAYVLALPLLVLFPWYPVLLLIPAVRNRNGQTILTILDHLLLGAGFAREWAVSTDR